MGRKTIKIINGLINCMLLTVIVLLIAFAGYALWDSKQIYQAADKANYAVYKPTAENQGKSFQELRALNPDVFAWLSVYGTNIDYPVTQGQDNMQYINTNAEGQYALSGSIFLDCSSKRDFSDFNSILYGHHMDKKMMFGEIGTFADKSVFDSHKYGNLYYDGKDHGIEFFAFVHTDAYDGAVYAPGVKESYQQAYLDGLLKKAMYKRDIGVTTRDRLVLLSTCSATSTNGRDLLIGRITDKTYDDTTINKDTSDGKKGSPYCYVKGLPMWLLFLALVFAALLSARALVTYHKWKLEKKNRDGGKDQCLKHSKQRGKEPYTP